jgi:hypothetical protein
MNNHDGRPPSRVLALQQKQKHSRLPHSEPKKHQQTINPTGEQEAIKGEKQNSNFLKNTTCTTSVGQQAEKMQCVK